MEVADRIHRLGDRYVNWYVIEDRGRLTVLDAGFPAHWSQLSALLTANGWTLRRTGATARRAHAWP